MRLATATLSLLLVFAALLTGCDDGDTPSSAYESPAVESITEEDTLDDVGIIAPYIRPGGNGMGVDLGNGLVLTPGRGFGFGS